MQLRASAIFFRNILQRATIAHVIYAIKLKWLKIGGCSHRNIQVFLANKQT
jgi:hypothetical protein